MTPDQATTPAPAGPPAPIAPPSPQPSSTDPLWYQDAVVYELHVKAFHDSNNDGIGDLPGLTAKLDYLADLGINTVWLLPFYPSPLRDDGYDIADYFDIHPSYGTLADFAAFVDAAHRRGLRVITELVINHTSDQHPWFQAARHAPKGSPERDFYVWSDDPNLYSGTRIIFTDTEKSNWTWDDVAGQYYWHRFFSHQPDLNFDNPVVRAKVAEVLRFWLDLGVDGFRLDAIPYLIERDGTSNENLRETHEVIRELRAGLDEVAPDRMFLAEANMWPEDVREYFGDSDECHMAYHFPLMPRMYMSVAQEDRTPITEIMAQTPAIPADCQWAIFLRNHDELTLEMVTNRERQHMWSTYASDPRARINVGIRRRLAPLMNNDRDTLKLMNALLLSMPGSPFIYYGDEIGMGDNYYLGDRDGVRTPMQWAPDRNGGFSKADPQRLYLPPIQDPVYGYLAVNVEAQQRDPGSLLNWTRRMLAVRRTSQAFGRGTFTMLHPTNQRVLAYVREYGEDVILCVANLSRSAQPVELDLSAYAGRVPVEMLGRNAFPAVDDRHYRLTLAGHGTLWFQLTPPDQAPHMTGAHPALPILVLFDGWNSFFRDRVAPWRALMAAKLQVRFEQELAPTFLAQRKWFTAVPREVDRVVVTAHATLAAEQAQWLLAICEATGPGWTQSYFLPLALAWEEGDQNRLEQVSAGPLARARQQADVGVIGDAVGDAQFHRAIVAGLAQGLILPTTSGEIRFIPDTGGDPEAVLPDIPVEAMPRELPNLGGNSAVQLGPVFVKTFRRLPENPQLRDQVAQFLTEVSPGCVPMGHVEFLSASGQTRTTLAIVVVSLAGSQAGVDAAPEAAGGPAQAPSDRGPATTPSESARRTANHIPAAERGVSAVGSPRAVPSSALPPHA